MEAQVSWLGIVNENEINPDFKDNLVYEMKYSVHSPSADGTNNKKLDKMNPFTVRIFYINI